MVLKGVVKQGEYFDSVSLMIVARQLTEMEVVLDAAVVMGTSENKAILQNSGMLLPEFEAAGDTDLLIGIKARDESGVARVFQQVDTLLAAVRHHLEAAKEFLPKSLDGALKIMPGANLALISVPGKYAAREAMKALERGLHVMVFSDNVPIEREIELKQYAREHGLLVMGPDCGTAMINGAPLAFANVVKRGKIGIVAASGTGLQEVSCVINSQGEGISQAIGTGGRDVSQQVGGVMFLEALHALNEDPQTRMIVLVSKPPHHEVFQKIVAALKTIHKPVVTCLIGEDPERINIAGVTPARTLEEAGMLAVALSQGKTQEEVQRVLAQRTRELKALAAQEAKKRGDSQKYLRGLFSGGTLCDEAQLILRDILGKVSSNTPISPECKLEDIWKNREHRVIDFGDDEFTIGRPHPMIDYSLRKSQILEEAQHPEVAVLLLDVVLGYGAHPHPEEEITPVIRKAKAAAEEAGRYLSVVCSITGTDADPQNKSQVEQALTAAGALVMPSNAAACELAGYICEI